MEHTKERGINAFFDETPVKNLVIKLGIPAMFAQFFNILYSIVDRIFVGRIPEVGDISLASIGVCAPALTAISAFAYMVGVGGASQMSIRLGQKDLEGAKKPVNNAFVMLVIISILVTAAALFFKKPLLYLLGCDDSMYPLASRYFTIYAAGTIFPLLGIGMNHFILAQGFSRAGMISVVIGALTNLILDPILIFVLDMGIEGAAIATVVAQAAMAVFTLWYLRRKKVPIRLEIGGYDFSVMKKIVLVGMMPFLITILDNGVVIILNASLRQYGGMNGTTYITCAAVIQSILTIVSCPAAGITQGCGTLYGYFYGAKETKKLDQTFTYVLWVCVAYIGGLQLLILLFPQTFAGLFLKDAAVMAVCVSCIRRFCLGLVGIAVQYAYVDGLTAMGKVKYALPLSLFRKTLYIILLITMPMFLPVENIFYAGSISDIIGASFTLVMFFSVVRKKLQGEMKKRNGGGGMIETNRLLLRPFCENDLDIIHQIYGDAEIMHYTPFDPLSREQAEAHLQKIMEGWKKTPVTDYEFAIIVKENGEKIGRCHIQIDMETDSGMIGWMLLKKDWGKGYATEMTEALLDYSFDVLHLHRVYALCNPENEKSWKVLEKFHLRREAHLKEKCRYTKNGESFWQDELIYAILKKEYKK